MKKLFPFIIRGGYDTQELFLQHKPEELMWYKFNIRVRSKTKITFVVYEMLDAVQGGRGKEIAQLPVNVTKQETQAMINEHLEYLAGVEYGRRQDIKKSDELCDIIRTLRTTYL